MHPSRCWNIFCVFFFQSVVAVFRLSCRVLSVWAVGAAVLHRMLPYVEPRGAAVPAAGLVSIRDTSVRTVGRFSVRRAAILRLRSSLPLLENHFSTVLFVLRFGFSPHCV